MSGRKLGEEVWKENTVLQNLNPMLAKVSPPLTDFKDLDLVIRGLPSRVVESRVREKKIEESELDSRKRGVRETASNSNFPDSSTPNPQGGPTMSPQVLASTLQRRHKVLEVAFHTGI